MIARTVRRAGDLWFLAAAGCISPTQQWGTGFLPPGGGHGALRRTLFFVSTVALVALALRFRRYWGAWLVAAGIVLNLVPMAAHAGAMPIDYEILESSGAFPEVTREDIGKQTNHGKDVVLERDDIHFFALSDRYVIDLPGYGTNVYSLGDFVLFAGVALLIVQAPLLLFRNPRQESPQAV